MLMPPIHQLLAWFKMLKNETFLEIFHHCASIVNKPFPSCHLLSYRVSRKDLLQIDDVNQIKTPTNYGVCLLPSKQKSVWNKSLPLDVSSAFFDKITKQITCHIGVSK